jgi:hypothetical protein
MALFNVASNVQRLSQVVCLSEATQFLAERASMNLPASGHLYQDRFRVIRSAAGGMFQLSRDFGCHALADPSRIQRTQVTTAKAWHPAYQGTLRLAVPWNSCGGTQKKSDATWPKVWLWVVSCPTQKLSPDVSLTRCRKAA